MNLDLINSILIMTAGGFIAVSVVKLYKDKLVHGVSPIHVGFFTVYGFWHIYFFSSLDQWWSVAGGDGSHYNEYHLAYHVNLLFNIPEGKNMK